MTPTYDATSLAKLLAQDPMPMPPVGVGVEVENYVRRLHGYLDRLRSRLSVAVGEGVIGPKGDTGATGAAGANGTDGTSPFALQLDKWVAFTTPVANATYYAIDANDWRGRVIECDVAVTSGSTPNTVVWTANENDGILPFVCRVGSTYATEKLLVALDSVNVTTAAISTQLILKNDGTLSLKLMTDSGTWTSGQVHVHVMVKASAQKSVADVNAS